MGVNIKDLLNKEEISLEDLKGKTLAVDAFNMLYQFLTTIRGPDGSYLTDSSGRITSHLIGLFNRVTSLMQKGIKLVFVFDGVPPELKKKERERRMAIKDKAMEAYERAVEQKDAAAMKKYAARTTRLSNDMIQDAKTLLTLLGVPIIEAPSEGEAQCAFMAKKGDVWGVASQDYDALLYGTPRLVQNLSIVGRRKKIHGRGTVVIKPELVEFEKTIKELDITQDQLIVLAILVGTDYDYGGVKGIGPKKGLKLIKAHNQDFDSVFSEIEWQHTASWKEIFDLFKNMPITEKYDLTQKKHDPEGLQVFLVEERDFSAERVEKGIENLQKVQAAASQKGLGAFF